jgi:hypothetical protein
MLSGALKAVLRIPGVVVVVGEKGALLSKTVP